MYIFIYKIQYIHTYIVIRINEYINIISTMYTFLYILELDVSPITEKITKNIEINTIQYKKKKKERNKQNRKESIYYYSSHENYLLIYIYIMLYILCYVFIFIYLCKYVLYIYLLNFFLSIL